MQCMRADLAKGREALARTKMQAEQKQRHFVHEVRKKDGECAALRGQLREAVLGRASGDVDGIFAKLPFAARPADDAPCDGVDGGRADGLNEENGELRALLAAIYLRLRSVCTARNLEVQVSVRC